MIVSAVLIVLLLVLVNALYVAAEFGAVGARRSRIHQLADDGGALAKRVLPIVDDRQRLDRYISVCQLGITISSLALGAYAQSDLSEMLRPLFAGLGGMRDAAAASASAICVLIAITFVQVVLGEQVPKSLALQYPNRAAMYTVVPVQWSERLLRGVIVVLNGSVNALLLLMRLRPTQHRHVHSPEEISILLEESRAGGVLDSDEHARLRRALSLTDRPVRRLMVPRQRIVAIDAEAPMEQTLQRVLTSRFTRLPVYRQSIDLIAGFVHTKDLLAHYAREGRVDDLAPLLRPALYVHESMTADKLIALMQHSRAQIAIVLDEFGGVAGLVTLEDALGAVFGTLARDGRGGAEPQRLPDGRVRLPGSMPLEDVETWLGKAWHGDANTVAGHVTEAIGRLPAAGEKVRVEGVDVEIEQVTDRVVTSVLAAAMPGGAAEDRDG